MPNIQTCSDEVLGQEFGYKSPREAPAMTAKVKIARRHSSFSSFRQKEQHCRDGRQRGGGRGSGFNRYLVNIQYVQDNVVSFAKKTRISKTSVPS